MKIRAPRKAKKQAKRLKSAHDAMVMVKAAMSVAMHALQVAQISSRPVPRFDSDALPSKALAITEVTIDAAKSMSSIMSEIKPWQEFVKPKMRHLC